MYKIEQVISCNCRFYSGIVGIYKPVLKRECLKPSIAGGIFPTIFGVQICTP